MPAIIVIIHADICLLCDGIVRRCLLGPEEIGAGCRLQVLQGLKALCSGLECLHVGLGTLHLRPAQVGEADAHGEQQVLHLGVELPLLVALGDAFADLMKAGAREHGRRQSDFHHTGTCLKGATETSKVSLKRSFYISQKT